MYDTLKKEAMEVLEIVDNLTSVLKVHNTRKEYSEHQAYEVCLAHARLEDIIKRIETFYKKKEDTVDISLLEVDSLYVTLSTLKTVYISLSALKEDVNQKPITDKCKDSEIKLFKNAKVSEYSIRNEEVLLEGGKIHIRFIENLTD